jgi:hypothetical protein
MTAAPAWLEARTPLVGLMLRNRDAAA